MENLKPQILKHQDTIIVPSPNNSTKLKDRILWFDGDSSIEESNIGLFGYKGSDTSGLYIQKISPSIEQYNQYAEENDQIRIKNNIVQYCRDWTIPDQYINLDIIEYVQHKADHYIITNNVEQNNVYDRISLEFKLYEKYKLFDLLKTLIYIINTFEENSCVYAGRGSSVSSFILYLIGVHDVDSLEYELEIHDFLHD